METHSLVNQLPSVLTARLFGNFIGTIARRRIGLGSKQGKELNYDIVPLEIQKCHFVIY